MIYTLKNSRKAKDDGYIYHEVAGEEDKIYRSMRAGLTWPINLAPAYFCILGQRHRLNELKRYPLVLIAEGQASDGFEILDSLVDLYKVTICSEIRADLTPDKKIFKDKFHDYCKENEVKKVFLRAAPWPDMFAYGLNMVQDWISKKSLEIAKGTVLASQLGQIPKDLKAYSANPEEDFFAVNALRYVLGSFQKHPHDRDDMKDLDYGQPEKYAGYYGKRL